MPSLTIRRATRSRLSVELGNFFARMRAALFQHRRLELGQLGGRTVDVLCAHCMAPPRSTRRSWHRRRRCTLHGPVKRAINSLRIGGHACCSYTALPPTTGRFSPLPSIERSPPGSLPPSERILPDRVREAARWYSGHHVRVVWKAARSLAKMSGLAGLARRRRCVFGRRRSASASVTLSPGRVTTPSLCGETDIDAWCG